MDGPEVEAADSTPSSWPTKGSGEWASGDRARGGTRYFERYVPYGGRPDHPVIIQEFRPGRGWITTGFRKRVSGAWLRKLRREGVTHVALAAQGRRADFTVAELLKHQKGQS